MSNNLTQFLQPLEEQSIAITVSDPDQIDCPLIFVNSAFEKMTQYNQDMVLGSNCRFLQGEDTNRQEVKTLRDTLERGESATATLTNYRADGTKFNNLIIIEPIFINADKKLFFGCQYEFGATSSEDEVTDHLTRVSAILSENESVFDQSRQMVARSMKVRSQTVFTIIRTMCVNDNLMHPRKGFSKPQ